MRHEQLPPTNDPAELADRTRELLVAERLLGPVFATTPPMWEDRFRNLDVQLKYQSGHTCDQHNTDNLWTAEQDTTHPSVWHIYPPKNNPQAKHPHSGFVFTHGPDGRRRFDIGPIAPHEIHLIETILKDGNEHPQPPTGDQWTIEPDPRKPSRWCAIPPANNPGAPHPTTEYGYITFPDGRRVIPFSTRDQAQYAADQANEGH